MFHFDHSKRYPQFSGLGYDVQHTIGFDGRPKFDFDRFGKPPSATELHVEISWLLNDPGFRAILDLSPQPQAELESWKQSNADLEGKGSRIR